MGEGKRILFVSNGYGEDNVAAHIAQEYRTLFPGHRLAGYPTVGQGRFYEQLGIQLVGRGIDLPSEGFVRSPRDFFIDIWNGLFFKTCRMGLEIRKASVDCELLIVVGDPYLLLFTGFFSRLTRENRIFIGLQQSEWYASKKPFKLHYSALERWWLKLYAGLVIVRDTKTRDYLLRKGLKLVYSAGNPMMDCFTISEEPVFPADRMVIGILPGSKKEAYENFGNIIETLACLKRGAGEESSLLFAVAFPPNLDIGVLERRYGLKRITNQVTAFGTTDSFEAYRLDRSDIELFFSKKLFGNILSESIAVIGLSGTANEQAAGLGKPVFAFWGNGPQITEKFLRAQKKLLGEALFIFPPEPERIYRSVHEVLRDKKLLKKARDDGMQRMAGRGSIRAIVHEIEAYINRTAQT